ncbi:hypothetical protein BVC80_285g63 [Macleaya cordata]|uniref:Uncharacterized protein n=1 Tax=Macleaya cordata TaxID=56857 RepID=A0A200QSB6_MACCD|nr:hypothetical protein BVC80_285g63 [Macleaya cordata]
MPTRGRSTYTYPDDTNYTAFCTEFYRPDNNNSGGLRSESTSRNTFNFTDTYPEHYPADSGNNSSRGHRLKTVPAPRSTFDYENIYTDLHGQDRGGLRTRRTRSRSTGRSHL